MKLGITMALGLLVCASPAWSGEWRVGPALAASTGIQDVSDIYEQNYNNTHTYSQVDIKSIIPVGLAVQGTYTWNSGVRVDMGLGPFFFLKDFGDGDIDTGLDYTEVPVSATVGYTFIPNGAVSPYVRAGGAYHITSGDYVESSSPGLLGAVGIEFMRKRLASVSLEVAVDKSKVEFERFQRLAPNVVRRTTEEIETYGTVISLIVKF
jgi:hypothetical protein